MKDSNIYVKALVNLVLYILVLALLVVLLPKAIAFFMPFVIGLIVSAIANPPVKFFEEKVKVKRKATSAIFIILVIALIIFAGYGIVVFLVNQLIGLVQSLPEKWPQWQRSLDGFGSGFNNLTKNLPADLREPINNIGQSVRESLAGFIAGLGSSDSTSSVISGISTGIGSVANVLVGIIMAVLSSYFFTTEHNALAGSIQMHMSEGAYSKINAAYRGLKNAIGGYFKAQFQIEVWVYVVTVIGLLIMRVDFAVVIALGIAILDLLPFFGAGLVMIPWSVLGFVNHDYFLAVGMLITWGVGQLVRQLIQPKIVGDNIGVAPLPTLFLLFIGYKLMGVFGMVIAVPVAMIFISLYDEGVFDTFICSAKILWSGISKFRKLPDKEEQEKKDNN